MKYNQQAYHNCNDSFPYCDNKARSSENQIKSQMNNRYSSISLMKEQTWRSPCTYDEEWNDCYHRQYYSQSVKLEKPTSTPSLPLPPNHRKQQQQQQEQQQHKQWRNNHSFSSPEGLTPSIGQICKHQWARDSDRRFPGPCECRLWAEAQGGLEISLPSLRSRLQSSRAFSAPRDLITKILMLVVFGILTRAPSLSCQDLCLFFAFPFCFWFYFVLLFHLCFCV